MTKFNYKENVSFEVEFYGKGTGIVLDYTTKDIIVHNELGDFVREEKKYRYQIEITSGKAKGEIIVLNEEDLI